MFDLVRQMISTQNVFKRVYQTVEYRCKNSIKTLKINVNEQQFLSSCGYYMRTTTTISTV